MKNIFYSMILSGCLLLPVVVMADHASDTRLIAKGARLYSENCGRCHNPRPASDYSKTEWSVVMPHMREKAHMTGDEALAVEAFLDSTLTADVRNQPMATANEKPVSAMPDPQKVMDKYGCQGCHRVGGTGGTLGPVLDGVVDRRGEDYVRQKLTNPKFDNPASAMPQFPLSKPEMDALIELLKQPPE